MLCYNYDSCYKIVHFCILYNVINSSSIQMSQNHKNGIDYGNCKLDIFQNTPMYIIMLIVDNNVISQPYLTMNIWWLLGQRNASLPDVQILGIGQNTYTNKNQTNHIVVTRVSYKQCNQSDRIITIEYTTRHYYTSRTYRFYTWNSY